MKNVIEVPAYAPTYRVYDKKTHKFVFKSKVLIDCVLFVCDGNLNRFYHREPVVSFTLKTEPTSFAVSYDSRRLRFDPIDPIEPARFVILRDDVIVNMAEIKTARQAYLKNRKINRDLGKSDADRVKRNRFLKNIRRKRNIDKVKETYSFEVDHSVRFPNTVCFKNKVCSSFKKIKTFQELKLNCGHVIEYGYAMVRGRRRKLPTAWDDIPCQVWKQKKSWKHNSKRRKQWKPR